MFPREAFDFAPLQFLGAALGEDAFDAALDDLLDVLLLAETHLEVELQELRLAVAAEVFVAEAAGDLEVTVEAADHRELLELLRRLGEYEERSGVRAGGDDIFARAFGRALDEARRIDFHAVLLDEVRADDLEDFGTQQDVLLHAFAAQIEVAVLEAQFFVRFLVAVDLERRGLGFVEDDEFRRHEFDGARGLVRALRALEALLHRARDLEHPFRTHLLRGGEDRFVFRLDDDLRETVAVAHVEEDEASVVTAAVHPSADGDGLADVGIAEFSAGVGTQHVGETIKGIGRQ